MENAKSQTPQTARIARKIRKLREKKKTAWKDVCVRLKILKEDGRPDTGLAYKIAYEGYEPTGRELRHRLGLRDICKSCRRPFRVPSVKPRPAKSQARVWFNGLKREERDQVLEWAFGNYLKWKQSHEA